jgi:D-proline reductase (dithiol) PrdB
LPYGPRARTRSAAAGPGRAGGEAAPLAGAAAVTGPGGGYVRYLDLINSVSRPLPPMPVADLGPPVLTPLRVPVRQARVMLLNSAGVHLRGDPPFQPTNDVSYRRIPATADPARLRPSHPTPMRRPGLRDVNVVFPYQRLAELAADGVIGGVTEVHLSMLGAIKRLRALADEVAPSIAAEARGLGADLLFVVPLCPACHQAMGVVARAVERCGLPTVCSTNARDITGLVKPPRSGFLNFPLGNCVGRPLEAAEQRAVCHDIVALADRNEPAGMVVDLPFQWPHPGWSEEVAAQYEREADVLRRQRSSEFHDGAHYAAEEVRAITGHI